MEFIEKVRNLCNERGTSVKQLEKELGFSNGSLAKGVPRADRLYRCGKRYKHFANRWQIGGKSGGKNGK